MLAIVLSGTYLQLQRKSLLSNFSHCSTLPQLILQTLGTAGCAVEGHQQLRAAWKGNAVVATLQMAEECQRTSYILLCSPSDHPEHHRVDFSYFLNSFSVL